MILRAFVTIAMLSSTAVASPAVEERTSYRWQTITADAVGLSLLFGAAAAEGEGGRDTSLSNALLGAGTVTMLAAAPLIHFSRDHHDRAKHSFALRGGLAA